jgi:proteasome lid subunit RPN8/RPN11
MTLLDIKLGILRTLGDKMEILELRIKSSIFLSIHTILKGKSLIERVGLIFGVKNRDLISIEHFEELSNLENSPKRFSIDYTQFIHYFNKYQELKKVHLGFFHTHPSGQPTSPSKIDEYYMKLWPSPYIWLIGNKKEGLYAYTWYQDCIIQVPYTVV